jgi:hypothetical protein
MVSLKLTKSRFNNSWIWLCLCINKCYNNRWWDNRHSKIRSQHLPLLINCFKWTWCCYNSSSNNFKLTMAKQQHLGWCLYINHPKLIHKNLKLIKLQALLRYIVRFNKSTLFSRITPKVVWWTSLEINKISQNNRLTDQSKSITPYKHLVLPLE